MSVLSVFSGLTQVDSNNVLPEMTFDSCTLVFIKDAHARGACNLGIYTTTRIQPRVYEIMVRICIQDLGKGTYITAS